MRTRPILFSGEMVRAVLAGRKTQTRRVIKPQPQWSESECRWRWETAKGLSAWGGPPEKCDELRPSLAALHHGLLPQCPYGVPGDRLWVRETCRAEEVTDGTDGVRYCADGWFEPIKNTPAAAEKWGDLFHYGKRPRLGARRGQAVPSIHMPRWASRITLEVVGVRVERVQDITESDALAEGVTGAPTAWAPYRANFRTLWDALNAARGHGWDANPWVWVMDFKRTTQ